MVSENGVYHSTCYSLLYLLKKLKGKFMIQWILGHPDLRQTHMIWHHFGAFLAPSGGCVWAQASEVLLLWLPWGLLLRQTHLPKFGINLGAEAVQRPFAILRPGGPVDSSSMELQLKTLMSLGHRAESVVCAELCGHQVPSSEAAFPVFATLEYGTTRPRPVSDK